MTAEKFHEALNLLPADLVSAADRLRSQTHTPRVFWKRWASLAACLAILICGTLLFYTRFFSGEDTAFQTGSAEDAAAEEPEMFSGAYGINNIPAEAEKDEASGATAADCAVEATYLPTESFVSDVEYPILTVIRSRSELDAYYEANCGSWDMDGFREACEAYDESYFREQQLVAVLLEETSGSIRHDVETLRVGEDGWELWGHRYVPEVCTEDMALWYILVQIPGHPIGPDDAVLLQLETVEG